MIQGFKEFISKGNVVDLAVGVVMGAAFGKIVTGLVESFINPLIAMLFGQPNFDSVKYVIAGTEFPIGNIITAVVNFFLIALAVYVFIVVPMNKLKDKMKKEEAIVEPAEEILLLREIRDSLELRRAKADASMNKSSLS
ncbi:large conductance mechanosensitive channel protein MscL [Suttonella indologenes]|uniref:Large-conductance mechanosensitive channel n=1 Tax=Suttonella indologenes TaxID=13276 RepID=A0A380MUQ9_9GAMM|nr:large conductance mechanosensitive channel protein MscL [Suttonella indologenes]SUO96002.1 Large-conductance mechanosensitive channel [Suttonella indologenes]